MSTAAKTTGRWRSALDLANEVKSERAAMFRALRETNGVDSRELAAELLTGEHRCLKNIYVTAFLLHIQKFPGDVGERMMERVGIPLTFTVGRLTERQRLALGNELRLYGRGRWWRG